MFALTSDAKMELLEVTRLLAGQNQAGSGVPGCRGGAKGPSGQEGTNSSSNNNNLYATLFFVVVVDAQVDQLRFPFTPAPGLLLLLAVLAGWLGLGCLLPCLWLEVR